MLALSGPLEKTTTTFLPVNWPASFRVSSRVADEVSDSILRRGKATIHIVTGVKQDEDIGASERSVNWFRRSLRGGSLPVSHRGADWGLGPSWIRLSRACRFPVQC